MKYNSIIDAFFALRDEKYSCFNAKLIPNIAPERIIGVRAPQLRRLASSLTGEERTKFLLSLPHYYQEENIIHAYIISSLKEPELVLAALDDFIPYVDNWAVCDSIRPTALKKAPELLYDAILRWLSSSHAYTLRFGIEMLMCYFLDEHFKPEYPGLVADVRSDEYYVKMMQAWYFATALAKQWDSVIPFLEDEHLSVWVHNKSIQKAIESYRINDGQKDYLRTLRR